MKSEARAFRYLTLISQFGINMLVPIFMCSFLGMYLDRKFDTEFLMIVLFFVGALAGFRNIYVLSLKMMRADEKKGKKKRTLNEESVKKYK